MRGVSRSWADWRPITYGAKSEDRLSSESPPPVIRIGSLLRQSLRRRSPGLTELVTFLSQAGFREPLPN